MKGLKCAASVMVALALVALPATAGQVIKGTIEGKTLCKLEGTAQGCCIGKLEKSIANVEGVKECHIDAKAGTATIVVKEGAKVSVEEIKKAVAEADKRHNHGFKVTEITPAK